MSLKGKDLIGDVLESNPTRADELYELPLHSVFISIGGYLAIGLGIFHFIVSMANRPFLLLLGHLIINIIFGVGLLLTNTKMIKKKIARGVSTIIISIILIAFGGIVGALSGIVALIGGILYFIKIER
ncbi:MAG: hypothetical protein ACQESD_00190 [Thermoplasmatota archaeon]